MARRILDIAAVLAAFLVVGVAAAAASPPQQVTDPSATSPAGAVYAIPLESARQDAAPHHASAAPVATSSPTSTSATASSGSRDGAHRGGARRAQSAGSAEPVSDSKMLVPGGQSGSLVASGNGFGASPEVPGLDAAASGGYAAVQGNGSDAPVLAIALAGVVLGAGAYLGTRGRRRGRGGSDASSS